MSLRRNFTILLLVSLAGSAFQALGDASFVFDFEDSKPAPVRITPAAPPQTAREMLDRTRVQPARANTTPQARAPQPERRCQKRASFVTEYYTMVNSSVRRKDCRGEGNQVVNGRLIGSNCRIASTTCKYGVGNNGNCLTPCMHGASGSQNLGKRMCVPAFKCPYGPLKGQTITSLLIADVGGAVGGNHVDKFMGLCVRKKMIKTRRGWIDSGNCAQYAADNVYANREQYASVPDESTATR